MKISFAKNLIIFLFKLMVLVTPLFFLPFSPLQLGIDNYAKSLFLSVMVLLISLLYIALLIEKKNFKLNTSPFDKAIFLFVFVALLASLFGVSPFVSFFASLSYGFYSFFSLLFLAMLYFVFTQLIDTKERLEEFFKIFLHSNLLVVVVAFLLLLFRNVYSLGGIARQSLGNSEDLAIYVVFILVLFFSLASVKDLFKKVFPFRFMYGVLVFLSVLILLMTDFVVSWWLLIVAMVILVYLRKVIKRGELIAKDIIGPVLLIIISINFLLNFYTLDGATQLQNKMAGYRQLGFSNTLTLSKDVLFDKPILGTGLENFSYAFSKYRDASLNEQKFWDLRYTRPGSFVLSLFISGGVLLLFAMLFLGFKAFVLMRRIWKYFKTAKSEDLIMEKYWPLLLIPTILVMALATVFYSSTINALFMFVLLGAAMIASLRIFFFEQRSVVNPGEFRSIDISLKHDKQKRLILFIIFSILLIFSIVYFSYSLKFALADQGVGKGKRSEYEIMRSVNLSPYRYEYHLDLANMYLNKTKESMKNGMTNQALAYQKKTLAQASAAQKSGKNSVVAQEGAGIVYRELSKGNDGNNRLALSAFSRARDLEPSNPVIHLEYANALYLAGSFEEAGEAYLTTKELKPAYKYADFGLARVMSAQKEYDSAIMILEEIRDKFNTADFYFELGMVYYNKKDYQNARDNFSKALTLSPLHANAMYGIAYSFDHLGEYELSLHYLKRLQKINPNNMEIFEKIEEIENKIE